MDCKNKVIETTLSPSKEVLEKLSESYVKKFARHCLAIPYAFDVDEFCEDYLCLNLDFHHLSHNGFILGMALFKEGNYAVFDPETKTAVYRYFKDNTVVIDSRLLEAKNMGRYRFTMAHECAHFICHRQEFLMKRHSHTCDNILTVKERNYSNFIEWQANYFAAALLMPRETVYYAFWENQKYYQNPDIVATIAWRFDVSKQAAYYRLAGLGLIE